MLDGNGADAVISCRVLISGREELSPARVLMAIRRARISIGHWKPHPPMWVGQRIMLARVFSADGAVGGERPMALIASEAISLRRSNRNSSKGRPSWRDHITVGMSTVATASRKTETVGEVVWQRILKRVWNFLSLARCSVQYPPGESLAKSRWKRTPR